MMDFVKKRRGLFAETLVSLEGQGEILGTHKDKWQSKNTISPRAVGRFLSHRAVSVPGDNCDTRAKDV